MFYSDTLPKSAASAALARRVLDRLEGRADPDALADARLLVFELVANAVEHVDTDGGGCAVERRSIPDNRRAYGRIHVVREGTDGRLLSVVAQMAEAVNRRRDDRRVTMRQRAVHRGARLGRETIMLRHQRQPEQRG